MRHRLGRAIVALCRQVLLTALRVFVTVLVSAVSLMVLLRMLGVPVEPAQLLKSVEKLSDLARILS